MVDLCIIRFKDFYSKLFVQCCQDLQKIKGVDLE